MRKHYLLYLVTLPWLACFGMTPLSVCKYCAVCHRHRRSNTTLPSTRHPLGWQRYHVADDSDWRTLIVSIIPGRRTKTSAPSKSTACSKCSESDKDSISLYELWGNSITQKWPKESEGMYFPDMQQSRRRALPWNPACVREFGRGNIVTRPRPEAAVRIAF